MELRSRWQKWTFSSSLRAKVTLSILFPLLVTLGIFTAVENTRQREAELKNLALLASHSGKVIENNLRYAMRQSNFSEVQHLLDSIGETEDFRIVYLLDTAGKVIFAPNGADVGVRLDNELPGCQPCHRLPTGERPSSVVVTVSDGQRVFRSMQPIRNSDDCAQCHDPAEPLIGVLLTDIPMAPLEAELDDNLRENLFWRLGSILVTLVIVNLVLSRAVIRRFEGLAQALAQFGGDHLSVRAPAGDPDEIGQLAAAFNKMGKRIEAKAAENRALSEHLSRRSEERGELLNQLLTVQEDERKRVSRELHDQLGQALSVLALKVEAIEKLIPLDPERAGALLNEAQELIDETSNQMYDLILALRPSALDDLGLAAALRAHLEKSFSGSISFEFDIERLEGRLKPEIETCLYRTYQEAVSNIMRHSGASTVRLSLAHLNGQFEGWIEDDGCGFDPDAIHGMGERRRGLGLLGMYERVTQCGGTLQIDSEPGHGTRIKIRIPVAGENGV